MRLRLALSALLLAGCAAGGPEWTGIGPGVVPRAVAEGPTARVEVVVSRYAGNLSWAAQVPELCRRARLTVYNKGTAAGFNPPCSSSRIVPLANRGREGHTYLYHIISRYDSLAEWTLFTQDDPFAHAPHFLPFLRTLLWDPTYLRPFQTFSVFGRPGQPPPSYPVTTVGKRDWLGNCAAYLEAADSNFWPHWPVHAIYRHLWRDLDYRRINAMYRARFLVPDGAPLAEDVWRRFGLPGRPTTPFIYSYSGIFAVHRDRVLGVPVDAYTRLLRAVELEPPRWPLVFTSIVLERSWAAMFNASRGERPPQAPPRAGTAPPGTCFAPVNVPCCPDSDRFRVYERSWGRRHPPREWSEVRHWINMTQSASCC